MKILESKAVQYARWCLEDGNVQVGKWVKLQAAAWLEIAEGKNAEAYVDEAEYTKICKLLKIMTHPDLHTSMYDGVENYAWLYIVATLCTFWRPEQPVYTDWNLTWEQQKIRYYQTSLLEISRKSHKTFYTALIIILLMLTADRFSRFFSVAPTLAQSKEIRVAARKIISSSPTLSSAINPVFKILQKQIRGLRNDTEYEALAYSKDNLDSKLAHAFACDEAGNLDAYPLEAMRSSQVELPSKTGLIISTQYPNTDNVFISEIDICKKILEKSEAVSDLSKRFALLYEPDEDLKMGDIWMSDDRVIYQANPVSVEKPAVFKTLISMRAEAILDENKRENFLCKHCNIQYKGLGVETFVDVQKVKLCRWTPDDPEWWLGRRVWVGLDFSMTEDNTAVAMSTWDPETEYIYSKVWGFIPGDEKRVAQKSKREHINYELMAKRGFVFKSGNEVISYIDAENLILSLEKNYGVELMQVGYDRYNALSSIQKFEEAGVECVEIKQHSSVLHSPTKLLKEKILKNEWFYEENPVLEENFSNARCTEDTNKNKYVNKKRSNGKVDEVVATINSIYLIEQDMLYGNDNFVSMVL